MTDATTKTPGDDARRLSLTEFTALMGMMSAMVAFSIDSMLPAMGEIADELTPDAPNRVQLVITSFFFGLGIGTFFVGPIADAIGRRATILAGATIYCVGAWLAWMAPSLEMTMAARVLQGFGVAGPRIASLALTRDLFTGREMAKVISLIMTIFALFPAAAPLIGDWIMSAAGWRSIYLAFIAFALICGTWFAFRQPETLAPEDRRPIKLRALSSGVVEILSIRRVRLSIAVQALAFTMIFLVISTTQQVFDQTFDRAEVFPIWFAVIALFSATSGIINARIVVRLGMRRVAQITLWAQLVASTLMTAYTLTNMGEPAYFAAYVVWVWTIFMATGFTLGNLSSLALEPLGHIAGLASSTIMALGTIGAVLISLPAGALFDGTPLTQTITIALTSGLGTILVRRITD